MSVEAYPDAGVNVSVQLSSGAVINGYWDGAVWWAGVNDMDQDVPLDGAFIVGWTPLG